MDNDDFPYGHVATPRKDDASGSLPGSPRSPIVVSDEDQPHHPGAPAHSSGSSDVVELTAKDRRRLKALRRMLPAAMIARQLKTGPNQLEKRKRAVSTSSQESENEERPLQPGQSRIRLASQPKEVHEIKGDSESSEPEGDLASDSDAGASNDPEPDDDSDVLDALDTEDEGGDSHALDDGEIEAWLDEKYVRHDRDRPRGGDLIDRMLSRTRTRTGGAKSRSRTAQKSTARAPRRSNLRIVTSGARKHGVERQTLLSFPRADHRSGAHNRSSHGPSRQLSTRTSATSPSNDAFGDVDTNGHMVTLNHTKPKSKKRRGRLVQGQLYVNAASGTRIESGRRRHIMTIDLEDDGFHEALAPLQRDEPTVRPKQRPKPRLRDGLINDYLADTSSTKDNPDSDRVSSSTSVWDRHNTPSNVLRDITADFDIPFLPSGISFGPSTFVGRGWLHELITHVAGNADILPPLGYSAFGLDLGPTTSAAEFVDCFPTLCDHAYSYATGSSSTADDGDVHKQWENILRVACQLVSWLPTNSSDDDYALMRTVVEDSTEGLIGRIEDGLNQLSLTGASLDFRAFSLYWFAVEISARLLCTLRARNMPLENPTFGKFILLLARRLYEYGIRRSLEPILAHDNGLDRLTTAQLTAELWIALLHLVTACQSSFPSTDVTSEAHPFWRIVHQVIQEDHQGSKSDLDASENIWRIIFSLTALSQFSVHGMTTSSPRLPASWTLVTVALKRIRLIAEPDVDHRLSSKTIYKRDGYVRLVVSRCFLLGKVWHWRFDDASVLFNQLVEIFRSRKFANLRGEVSDFPRFMRLADFGLLSEYKAKDTAFAVFLKLVVQASKDMGANVDPDVHSVPPKLKRLLSLMVPVGSVPFTKSTPPTGAELSMLYNRLSAVSVAILLEPTSINARTRVAQARRFVKFSDTDLATRQACIRGMMHLTTLLQSLRLVLDDTLSWLSEMTNNLVDEHRELGGITANSGTAQLSAARDRVVICIQLLIGSVRHIIETPTINRTAQEEREYPDPALLEGRKRTSFSFVLLMLTPFAAWVTKIFAASTNLTNSARTCVEVQRLVQAFLNARAEVMPPPRRPPLAPLQLEESESQDEYGEMEFDMDDPELLAALGAQTEPIPLSENKIKDKRVAKVRVKFFMHRTY